MWGLSVLCKVSHGGSDSRFHYGRQTNIHHLPLHPLAGVPVAARAQLLDEVASIASVLTHGALSVYVPGFDVLGHVVFLRSLRQHSRKPVALSTE